MTANDKLAIWDAHADIDPKFTKAITGKAYKGTSPNPHYVIYCLTKLFGPVGQGFGWRVLAEDFTPLGGETLHWCRIEFWHTDRANTFEAYGQTKSAYTTSSGKVMVDEDAPKKSLTDAIVKAASQIGIAANIFLGRWDDSRYVAEVAQEFRQAERSASQSDETRAELDWFANALPAMSSAEQINAVLGRASNAGAEAKRMVADRAKAMGLTFNKQAGAFEAAGNRSEAA